MTSFSGTGTFVRSSMPERQGEGAKGVRTVHAVNLISSDVNLWKTSKLAMLHMKDGGEELTVKHNQGSREHPAEWPSTKETGQVLYQLTSGASGDWEATHPLRMDNFIDRESAG